MEPTRILCLRFPNWPIQAHRLRVSRENATVASATEASAAVASASVPSAAVPAGVVAVALHTPLPDAQAGQSAVADADTLRDLVLLRQLFPAARSGPAVVAVSSAAWKQGVRPGLPLAEARSLATPLQAAPQRKSTVPRAKQPPGTGTEPVVFVPWNPSADRAELQLLSDPVRRFAPVVGLDSLPLPDSLLLNVTGCGPLFGGEEQLAKELLQMLRQCGLRGRVCIADNIATAWAVAHTDLAGAPELVVVAQGNARQRLDALPVSAARLTPADLEILQHLGILRIGQLLALPIEDLPARLSAECVMRVRQLRGDVVEQIDPLPELRPVQAAWAGDEPAVGVRDLQWILGQLCVEIAGQLEERRLACSGLQCEFIAVDGRSLSMPAGLVRPERTSQLLADVLSLRLEFLVLQDLRKKQSQRTSDARVVAPGKGETRTDSVSMEQPELPPLDFGALAEQPIVAVRVTAVSSPIPVGRQRRLFADAGEPAEDVTEPLGTLLSRLAGRLGADAVLTAQERDDPRPEHSIGLSSVAGAGFEGLLDQLAGTNGGQPGSGGRSRRLERSAPAELTGGRMKREFRETGRTPVVKFPGIGGGDVSSIDFGPSRPLRLLPEPAEVALEWVRGAGSAEGVAERPGSEALLRCLGREWRVVEWTGPERIQTAWWTDSACHRDYYQAVAAEGARFWLFRDLADGRWYLHGIYD